MAVLRQGPDPDPRPPRLNVPGGLTDCHFHILGPATQYPYVSGREYTPPAALPAAYRHLAHTLGIERGVLIQPSVYGTDNRCQIDAASVLGISTRLIVVVPPETGEDEFARLHEAGARGIRFMLVHAGGLPIADLERCSARIREFGWHIQLTLGPKDLVRIEPRLARLPTDYVIDHMGLVRPADGGPKQLGFQALLRLLRGGRCWVKLSNGYRLSSEAPPYRDLLPLVQELVKARPDRLLWGSDWPHVAFKGKMPNTTDLLDLLLEWVQDDRVRKRILIDNPSELFGF